MAITFVSSSAQAAYPERAIKVIVPFAAGGGVDIAGRLLANALAEELKCTVVVDNRGGAGGINGMDAVAKATPDGYTLLTSHSGFTAMPGLYQKLPFDPVKDFAAIVTATSNPTVLAVRPTLPFMTVADLVAYARANPRSLTFASAGIGSVVHLAGELLKRSAGVEILHVPYKGAGPAIGDLLGGHVDMMFAPLASIVSITRSGELRGLAVTSQNRSIYAPELTTMIEAGFDGFVVDSWYGLAAPAATPREIVAALNVAINRALATPAVIELLRKQGMEQVGGPPDEAAAFIRTEVEKWTHLIREAGIKPQ